MSERIDTARIKQGLDLRDLAAGHTELRKWSAGELAGPCPKCGGEDRFHVKAEWFKCYQCHDKRGDAIEFVQWLGLAADFKSATELLSVGRMAVSPARRQRPEAKQRKQPVSWQYEAVVEARAAYHALLEDPAAEPGRAYLQGRGLEIEAWEQYRLGYCLAKVPGTEGQVKAPAISIPWFAGGKVMGIRYRFLELQQGHKQTSKAGSQFSGHIFGRYALLGVAQGLRSLLLCEGEINAISCWQAANCTGIDVLSVGSEGAQLSDQVIELSGRYQRALVWFDKEEWARAAMAAIPGAYGLKSPGGQDANDLLLQGLLGGFLVTVRADAARDRQELAGLVWDLWDGSHLRLDGLDTGTAAALGKLASKLGLEAPLRQSISGR